MSDWRISARGLVEGLAARGVLADPAWRAAFEQVPRHVFVPEFYRDDRTCVSGDNPDQYDEWLAGVYTDTSLVTQYRAAPGVDLRISTSSSTMPSLMARMLHLLDVADGHRVAEVGTGTGYNTALLCHRLGDSRVASIDIDPDLIRTAAARLASIRYQPFLTAGTGANGIAEHAPYHRIIATCAVASIPPPWIRQLEPDGLIVADLRGEISSSLVQLRKVDHQTVQGRFLPTPGHFMWLRANVGNPLRDGGTYPTTINVDDTRQHTTTLDPAILDDPDLRFLIQLRLPGIRSMYRDEHQRLRLRVDDGVTQVDTTPHDGRYHYTETGPSSPWTTIEDTTHWWDEHRRPARSRFGLTATTTGAHHLWLDHPDTTHWDIPDH